MERITPFRSERCRPFITVRWVRAFCDVRGSIPGDVNALSEPRTTRFISMIKRWKHLGSYSCIAEWHWWPGGQCSVIAAEPSTRL